MKKLSTIKLYNFSRSITFILLFLHPISFEIQIYYAAYIFRDGWKSISRGDRK